MCISTIKFYFTNGKKVKNLIASVTYLYSSEFIYLKFQFGRGINLVGCNLRLRREISRVRAEWYRFRDSSTWRVARAASSLLRAKIPRVPWKSIIEGRVKFAFSFSAACVRRLNNLFPLIHREYVSLAFPLSLIWRLSRLLVVCIIRREECIASALQTTDGQIANVARLLSL